jgi:hypothetical protein
MQRCPKGRLKIKKHISVIDKVCESIINFADEEMKLDMLNYGETIIRMRCNADGALIVERVPPEDTSKIERPTTSPECGGKQK